MNTLHKGFTLIEIMIVIAIIGILSTALFPSIEIYMARARDSTRIGDLMTINKALRIYETENGKFPTAMHYPLNEHREEKIGFFQFIEDVHAIAGPPPMSRTDDKCISYLNDMKLSEILPKMPKDPQSKNPFPCLDSMGVGSYGFSTGTNSEGKIHMTLTAELERESLANIGYFELETALSDYETNEFLGNKKKGDYIPSPGDIPYYVIYE